MNRWVLLGVGVFGGGVLMGSMIGGGGGNDRSDHSKGAAFERLAERYDLAVDRDERWAGVWEERKAAAASVHGRVLEVGAGTGRNLEHLAWDRISEYVAVDASPAMVAQLQLKLRSVGLELKKTLPQTQVVVADVLKLPFADDSFDSVLSTFSLCSVDDPAQALREMNRVLAPGGSLVLLEHGRASSASSWTAPLTNGYLDLRARSHEASWGCSWNRPIETILQESGLPILVHKTHLLGTGHRYVIEKQRRSE